MRILTSIAFILLITSCSDFERNERLEAIDSLSERLEEVAKGVDDTRTELNVEEIKENVSEMSRVLSAGLDTITIEQAKLIDQFKIVRSGIDPFNELTSYIDTNLTRSRLSLELLRDDIEHSQGKRQNYDEYISYEGSKIDSLEIQLEELIKIKSSILASMDICYPAIINELEPKIDTGINIDE